MKIKILSLDGKENGEKELPKQFNEKIRPVLIKRAVLTIQSNSRQKYGVDSEAGKKYSAELSRRRHKYRGSYGFGISRVPRKILSRRGTRLNWVGAFAPGTVGGRKAHPPKSEKNWDVKINKKENRKAIRSAMAAVMDKEIVEKRGHIVPKNYPFIIDSKLEDLDKTKKVKEVLCKIGLGEELERSAKKKVRAGKGKARGRKYKKRKGPLLIVADDCKLLKGAKNLPGVDILKIEQINAEVLAPGCDAGRLTVFTDNAIEKLSKNKMFM